MIPLERKVVRFIDNFSTGTRGACIAEYVRRRIQCELPFLTCDFLCRRLLSEGYAVIYLHRKGCRKPYVQYTGELLSDLIQQQLSDATGPSECAFARRTSMLTGELCKHLRQGNYLEVPFETVQDYLFALREISCSLQPARAAAMVVLSAAVSDFYIPMSATSEHKIQSFAGASTLDLHLLPVPKALGALRQSWCPDAFAMSFKLETDPDLLMPKATAALQRYNMHAVVANLLDKRYSEVFIISQIGAPTSSQEVVSSTKFEHFRRAVAGTRASDSSVHAAWSMQSNSFGSMSTATCALTLDTHVSKLPAPQPQVPKELALEDALVSTLMNLHSLHEHQRSSDLK
jgi:phosphopantothenate-cysteine ligase